MAQSVEKALGALPVVAGFCRRLDLAGIIDRAVPVRDIAYLSHGQVIEALVANRLTAPAPLVRVADWAGVWAVPEVVGIEADLLNDDRIGRALDAIAPYLESIVGSAGAGAIGEFGIDVARLHWDMTSISLFGDYETAHEEFPAPRFGHPKDRRVDLKQIQAGLAVSGDGGIPGFHRAYDGGAGEVDQVVGAMTALKKMAGKRAFLLVGDSALISYGNLAAMIAARVSFVAPASKTYVPAGVLAGLDYDTAADAGYIAGRDRTTSAADRNGYRVCEDTMTISGPRKSDPALTLRRVFVHSGARAVAAAHARTKKLQRARADLGRLRRGLGTRYYPDEAAVRERIATIASSRRVKAYLRADIGCAIDGRPTLVLR